MLPYLCTSNRIGDGEGGYKANARVEEKMRESRTKGTTRARAVSGGKRVRRTVILGLLRCFRSALAYSTVTGRGSIEIACKLWEFLWSNEPMVRERLVAFVFELDQGHGAWLTHVDGRLKD